MAFRGRWPISRRTMLRGMGACVALPWLEAMTGRARGDSADPQPPVRLGILYMPNGALMSAWKPEGEGRDFKLSYILEPLQAHKDDVLVITNLRNTAGKGGDGHYAKTTSWLTGARAARTSGKGIRAGVSVDQLAAERIGRSTPLTSLELGIDPVHNLVDMGYSTVYGCHISWRTPILPAAKEIDPRQAFDRLFRSTRFGQSPGDKSVLDLVGDDARRLRKELGGADRQKLEEYFDSLRELEDRIARAARAEDRNWKAVISKDDLKQPQLDYGDYTTHVRLMLDVMFMAFWTDSTRVASFMFANDVSGRNFSFVDGVHDGFHPLSHHELNAQKQEQYKRINRYHIEQFSYLLNRMRAIKEGDRTLLDNSMILFGSSIADGNAHSPTNVPTVLAGRGGGRIDSGRHIDVKGSDGFDPLCNLFVTMLGCLGVPVDQFGDSNGSMDKMVLAPA